MAEMGFPDVGLEMHTMRLEPVLLSLHNQMLLVLLIVLIEPK